MPDGRGLGQRHGVRPVPDYSFFVPTEGAEGKRTVVQGEAFYAP